MYILCISIIIMISCQLTKYISFKQALNQSLSANDTILVILLGIVVVSLVFAARAYVIRDYSLKLLERKKNNARGKF